MNDKLQHYLKAFTHLNVNRSGGRPSPHKPVMLLSLLELAETGRLPDNRIHYDQRLIETFRSFFHVVQKPGDTCNPYFPFFHLRSEPFWHLNPRKGKENILQAMPTVRGPTQVLGNIEYAHLDDELYALFQKSEERSVLRSALVNEWFPQDSQVIRTVAAEEKRIVSYEKVLQSKIDHVVAEDFTDYAQSTRDSAFSRVVREAYDYRCAASGTRVILPDGSVMVEAAHIVPFSLNHDDDPRNGIALAPNFHWAIDRHILAPGPDLKWHISTILDKRNRDYKELIDLDMKPLMLPSNNKYYPKMDALEWRMEKLVQ